MPAIKSDNISATSFLRWQFYTEHSKTDISRGVIRDVNRKLSVKALGIDKIILYEGMGKC